MPKTKTPSANSVTTFLDNEIARLEQRLKACPKGELFLRKNGNHMKWFVTVKGRKSKYLPKKERELAVQLAAKKLDKARLTETRRRRALESQIVGTIEETVKEALTPEKYDHLIQLAGSEAPKSWDEEVRRWAAEEYPEYQGYAESLRISTRSGRKVRSKSELMICNLLEELEIPYRYEDTLAIDGMVFHPDFLLRHPRTGAYYILEHFGMLDDEEYTRNMLNKLYHYSSAGFVLYQNLIPFGETKDHPFDINIIEKLLRAIFL